MRSERIFGVGFPRAESGRNPRSRIPDSARTAGRQGFLEFYGGAGFLEFYGGAGFTESVRLLYRKMPFREVVFDAAGNPAGFPGFPKKTHYDFAFRQGWESGRILRIPEENTL